MSLSWKSCTLLIRNKVPCGYFKNFGGTNSCNDKKEQKTILLLSSSTSEHTDIKCTKLYQSDQKKKKKAGKNKHLKVPRSSSS